MTIKKVQIVFLVLLVGVAACGKSEPLKTENPSEAQTNQSEFNQSTLLSQSKCAQVNLFEPSNLNKIQWEDVKKADGTYQLESANYYAALGLQDLSTGKVLLSYVTSNTRKSNDTFKASTDCYQNDGVENFEATYKSITSFNAKDLTSNNQLHISVNPDQSNITNENLNSSDNPDSSFLGKDSKQLSSDEKTKIEIDVYQIDQNHIGIQLKILQSETDSEVYVQTQYIYSYHPEVKAEPNEVTSKLDYHKKVLDFAKNTMVINHNAALQLADGFTNSDLATREKAFEIFSEFYVFFRESLQINYINATNRALNISNQRRGDSREAKEILREFKELYDYACKNITTHYINALNYAYKNSQLNFE